MKRLQIRIDEDVDAALALQASEEGVSKAALIQRYVEERLRPLPPIADELDRKRRAADELLTAEPVPVPETVGELKAEIRAGRGW